MANILIDGYNLIGLSHRNLEAARSEFIKRLNRYGDIKNHSITVVFDGWKDGSATETREKMDGVTVIYSRIGEKADDAIKNILSSAAKLWIVVSSDLEISNFAEKKRFVALTRDEFTGKLYSALDAGDEKSGEEAWPDDEDDDPRPGRQKGNPRKLSRREKRKIEAIGRL